MGTVECPFCQEIFEIKPPDKIHTAVSSQKPILNSYYGKLVEKWYRCPNPECKKSVTIFWYAPLDYFSRI